MATKPTRFAQMGDTTEKVKAYVGIPKQLVVDTSKWRMRLLDGATPGGFEFAMVRDLQDYATSEVCTQLIYEINEVRRKSTAYQVGDKVDCAFQYERFLECTKAGTTSADLLDTRNVTHGQVIADGTVEWTVRTHVRSINGSVAGADGNVLVDVGAKTVNGNRPDGSGNVAVDVGVKTVNGNRPDGSGNVNLGLHAVATSGNYNDLSNKPKVYVTETWHSGTSWYRVWSDGWIEQGGTKAGALFNGASQTLTLPKAYKNASYIITGIGVYKSGVGGYASIGENSVTKNSFKYAGMGGASRDGIVNFYWYTCGY